MFAVVVMLLLVVIIILEDQPTPDNSSDPKKPAQTQRYNLRRSYVTSNSDPGPSSAMRNYQITFQKQSKPIQVVGDTW